MSELSCPEIICPYCKETVVNNSWEYSGNEEQNVSCASCNKEFLLFTEVWVKYSSYRIDCKEERDMRKVYDDFYECSNCDYSTIRT